MAPAQTSSGARHLLHVFASFGLGGVPIRICEVINALKAGFSHTIVALDDCFDAGERISANKAVRFRSLSLPSYNLPLSIVLVRSLLQEETPDLLLTYNWGAIEVALANRVGGGCRHIHFESGFGAEEKDGSLWRRNIFRRFALGSAEKVVVPSNSLMQIAAKQWRMPPGRLQQIVNGVDCQRYDGTPGRRENGEFFAAEEDVMVIGTVAPLRPEKNIGRLLHAFAALRCKQNCILVVAGDGEELTQLRRKAEELEIGAETHFLGHVVNVPAFLRCVDIFALSSDTEQMPNSLLQAMAAGRPVAAVDVGDVALMVAPENREFVVCRDSGKALTEAIARLVNDRTLRESLGLANQTRARANYSLKAMVDAYEALFASA